MLKALRCKLSMSMCREELIGAGARVNTKQTDETREVGQKLQVTQALQTKVKGLDFMSGWSETPLRGFRRRGTFFFEAASYIIECIIMTFFHCRKTEKQH